MQQILIDPIGMNNCRLLSERLPPIGRLWAMDDDIDRSTFFHWDPLLRKAKKRALLSENGYKNPIHRKAGHVLHVELPAVGQHTSPFVRTLKKPVDHPSAALSFGRVSVASSGNSSGTACAAEQD